MAPRIAILVVAYNAAATLRQVLDRIPREVWDKVEEVMVFDDSSQDDTFRIGLGYKELHGRTKLGVFRNEKNLGYGANQIRGYRYAIQRGYDIVALLHGDGQYAPEALPELLGPLERGEADAVFGSRMMTPGGALRGGMPLYKYVGNRILTSFENAALGTALSEFHSGYRLYSCHALKQIPFERNTHAFHFDTQIIVQLLAAGLRIVERPIPTYYGDEICHVNGIKYAKDVVKSVLEYRLHSLGVIHRPEYELSPDYALKQSPLSSHSRLVQLVGPPRRRVLDVGSGSGELGHLLRQRGHEVVGVDVVEPRFELDAFYRRDLREGLGFDASERFDVVVMADVLEHLPDPLRLLEHARQHLSPRGRALVSLPNAVHWWVRSRVAAGRFDYANRGILDRGHLRFFTRASAERLFDHAGFRVLSRHVTPIPWEHVVPDPVRGLAERADYFLARLQPNAFAYQHVFELERSAAPD